MAPATTEPLLGLLLTCALAYLAVYAIEGPVRYVLYLAGKDSFIFVRDALILGPLAVLFCHQSMHLRLHPAFLVAGALFAFHGMVLMGTVGSFAGGIYGVKVVINILFGFFVAGALLLPGKRAFRFLLLIWIVTLIGAVLDKAGVKFPWIGMTTHIGSLDVDVSRDWEITDALERRVAGFTRSSIAIAAMLPPVSIVLMNVIKHRGLRCLVAILSLGVIFLTTQKGALIAFTPILLVMCATSVPRLSWLRTLAVLFMMLSIAAPIAMLQLHMEHGAGVFSTESLWLRIAYTWPQAWTWITHHQLLWFGVGLGGIGGPQRLYALNDFNPADNIFILMYAYFGVFAFVYLGFVLLLLLRPPIGSAQRVVPAIAILAYAFGYGTVLSIIEDQASTVFIGAAIGLLWRETRWSAPVQSRVRPVRHAYRPAQ